MFKAVKEDNNKKRRSESQQNSSIDDSLNGTIKKQALEEHKKTCVNLSSLKPPLGFFLPRTKEEESGTKSAVIGTGSIDETEFNCQLEEHGFRPVEKCYYSPGGKVSSVDTPGGTNLRRQINLGAFVIFSNDNCNNQREVPSFIDKNKLILTPPRNNKKTISVVFNSKQTSPLKKIGRDQAKVMSKDGTSKNARATDVAQDCGVAFDQERFEWLHLICYRMLGELGQNKDNLVTGTFHANTLMIPVEMYLPHLKKHAKNDVRLDVTAEMLAGSQIAKQIDYVITIQQPEPLPPIKIEFKFDALLEKPPSRHIKTAIDLYMKNVFTNAEKVTDEVLKSYSTANLEEYLAVLGLEQCEKVLALDKVVDEEIEREVKRILF